MNLFEKVFGTHSERELKLIYPIVDKIVAMRPEMMALTDEQLRDRTRIFKERLANGETLDDILPEAFATVREAARRVLNMEHYPVQLVGGIVLHQGRIAEMKTGEGKTLVSTAPAYLNALMGKGVHIVTVNDYLAKRDAEQMGQVHEFLGLTVGVVLNAMTPEERKNPKLMNLSRKGRIAKGAGVDIAVVNRFIKQFEQSQKMMKQMPGLMGGKRGRGMFGGMKFPF